MRSNTANSARELWDWARSLEEEELRLGAEHLLYMHSELRRMKDFSTFRLLRWEDAVVDDLETAADKPKKEGTKKGKTKPRTKQREARHIKGDAGVEIVRRKLPVHWVARPINPDYGLDLHVEVFEPDSDDPASGNTLGEHFYVQVKTAKAIALEKVTVRSRGNVTKYDPDPTKGDPVEIEVAKFSLDRETLLTVETMGAAVPVVLCYVDLSKEKVYYVCLNDYLAKALLPYKPPTRSRAQ